MLLPVIAGVEHDYDYSFRIVAVANLEECQRLAKRLRGLGVGYLKPEFDALGVEFSERNELFDECLAACRLAWRGGCR